MSKDGNYVKKFKLKIEMLTVTMNSQVQMLIC